jgi:alcohol dehydrogenase class IV
MMLPSPLLFPARTVTGAHALLRLAEECAVFGGRGVIVHGSAFNGDLRNAVLDAFPPRATLAAYRHRGGEPTLVEVEALRGYLRDQRPDWVAGIGGGSVLDLAKAATGLLHAPASVAAYQQGREIPAATVPFIAVPTTAGTGSEATSVAVLTDAARNLKQSIRHRSFMPRTVLLDPILLHSCPRPTLAAAGMDALTQAYESWVSRHATVFTRDLSARAFRAIIHSLPALYHGDTSAAPDLIEGSYLAGLALSHARLGIVHGLAHPLGARFQAPHGLACACCLPAVLRFNAEATATWMPAIDEAAGGDFARWVDEALAAFDLVSPFKGAALDDRAGIIAETLGSGSTRANPRDVTADDVDALLNAVVK